MSTRRGGGGGGWGGGAGRGMVQTPSPEMGVSLREAQERPGGVGSEWAVDGGLPGCRALEGP